MGFQEILPAKPISRTTGVRVNISESRGVSISLSGEALKALKGAQRVKVLIDFDPGYQRMRIVADAAGKFQLAAAPGRGANPVCILRIGHRSEWQSVDLKGLDCIWERTSEENAIDIDLPRELRAVEKVERAAMNGLGDVRKSNVSLPAVGRSK